MVRPVAAQVAAWRAINACMAASTLPAADQENGMQRQHAVAMGASTGSGAKGMARVSVGTVAGNSTEPAVQSRRIRARRRRRIGGIIGFGDDMELIAFAAQKAAPGAGDVRHAEPVRQARACAGPMARSAAKSCLKPLKPPLN